MSRALFLNSSIGEYRLVDFLGEGGMGEVYRGVHSKIGRVVAVKVLTREAANSGFIERFRNEARIQSSLNHPNIATLYDFLEANGQPCIIMEFVDGQVLMDLIAARGALAADETLRILQSVVEALQYVHSQGIVHRDIKSNNIKINSSGEIKLLDFGIAKGGSSPSLTMTGDVIGTLHYLSPEQIRGGVADSRSDIWALGVLMYEMITGRLPFEATTLGDLCDKISKATYLTPSALNLSLPREVERILARCLKKRPEDRYQSAADLLRDIRHARDTTQNLSAAPTVLSRADNRTVPAPLTPAATVAPVPKSRAKLWAVAALVFCALLIGIYVMIPGSETATPSAAPGPEPQANKNAAQAITPNAPMKSVRIESMEGPAEVFIDGNLVGVTPYPLEAPIGKRVHLVLKREGFQDRQEEFEVTERNVYTFSLKNKKQ